MDGQGCPADSDADKVPDYRDDCPNDVADMITRGVTERGCPVDSDNDGVQDYRDDCPLDKPEAIAAIEAAVRAADDGRIEA